MEYYFIPTKIAIIKKTILSADRGVEKLDPSYILVIMKNGKLVLKKSLAIFLKVQQSYQVTQQFYPQLKTNVNTKILVHEYS